MRRELYRKHMEYFRAGATHRERLFLAANRIGKTEGVGLYETTLHLTGCYPDWWDGKRFDHAIKGWAAGDTNKTVRDILQFKLLGKPGEYGTGLIPGDLLQTTRPKAGIPDAVEIVYVEHVSGKSSILTLKSYQEGRESFQGSELDWILLDEEPPLEVYAECVIRTMTTGGLIALTFTPINGWTQVVEAFLKETNGETNKQVA